MQASPDVSPTRRAQSPGINSNARSLAFGFHQLDVGGDSDGGAWSPLHDGSAAPPPAEGPHQDDPSWSELDPSILGMLSREGSPTRPPGHMGTPLYTAATPDRLPLPEQWASPSTAQAGADPSATVQVVRVRYKRSVSQRTAYLCIDSGSRFAPNGRSCKQFPR